MSNTHNKRKDHTTTKQTTKDQTTKTKRPKQPKRLKQQNDQNDPTTKRPNEQSTKWPKRPKRLQRPKPLQNDQRTNQTTKKAPFYSHMPTCTLKTASIAEVAAQWCQTWFSDTGLRNAACEKQKTRQKRHINNIYTKERTLSTAKSMIERAVVRALKNKHLTHHKGINYKKNLRLYAEI